MYKVFVAAFVTTLLAWASLASADAFMPAGVLRPAECRAAQNKVQAYRGGMGGGVHTEAQGKHYHDLQQQAQLACATAQTCRMLTSRVEIDRQRLQSYTGEQRTMQAEQLAKSEKERNLACNGADAGSQSTSGKVATAPSQPQTSTAAHGPTSVPQPGSGFLNQGLRGLWFSGQSQTPPQSTGQRHVITEQDLPAMAARQHPGEKWGYLQVHMNQTDSVGELLVVRARTQPSRFLISIIMAVATDPVGAGVVDSLSRPGGNISGMTLTGPELTPKRLELLKIVAPDVQRLVVVVAIDIPVNRLYLQQAEAAASALAIKHVGFEVIGVSASGKWEEAFARLGRSPPTALLITESPSFSSEGRRLAALALTHHLPAVYGLSGHVLDGGLMSYGADVADLYYRAARLVGKILLEGAKPADLPVEQPTKYELVINLKTAKALGLTIPQSLLLRADQVIQ